MYASTDLFVIQSGYFTVIKLGIDCCEIKSNNTRHTWRISQSTDGYFVLLHKHRDKDKFHFHRGCISIEDCLLEIVGHDDYQLRGRKPERFKRRTYFDDIIDIYNNSVKQVALN